MTKLFTTSFSRIVVTISDNDKSELAELNYLLIYDTIMGFSVFRCRVTNQVKKLRVDTLTSINTKPAWRLQKAVVSVNTQVIWGQTCCLLRIKLNAKSGDKVIRVKVDRLDSGEIGRVRDESIRCNVRRSWLTPAISPPTSHTVAPSRTSSSHCPGRYC